MSRGRTAAAMLGAAMARVPTLLRPAVMPKPGLFIRSFAPALVTVASCAAFADQHVASLVAEFEQHSGARLVFVRDQLPQGDYYEVLKPLDEARQAAAATICLREASKYPRGFLAASGFKAVGVFAACVSRTGDGFRPYNETERGYFYFGIYNGEDGVAVSFYNEAQLPLTFHHEIFHHVDSTHRGVTESWWMISHDDNAFRAAVAGEHRYPAPTISESDLRTLRQRSSGSVLRNTVSDYAAKNPREDQAETARYLMSHLPDALLQAVERPRLARQPAHPACDSRVRASHSRRSGLRLVPRRGAQANSDRAAPTA